MKSLSKYLAPIALCCHENAPDRGISHSHSTLTRACATARLKTTAHARPACARHERARVLHDSCTRRQSNRAGFHKHLVRSPLVAPRRAKLPRWLADETRRTPRPHGTRTGMHAHAHALPRRQHRVRRIIYSRAHTLDHRGATSTRARRRSGGGCGLRGRCRRRPRTR